MALTVISWTMQILKMMIHMKCSTKYILKALMLQFTAGNTKRSTENLASRPGSVVRARSPVAPAQDTQDETASSQQELVAVPSQTIFIQTVDFLLEVKAMPVSQRVLYKTKWKR